MLRASLVATCVDRVGAVLSGDGPDGPEKAVPTARNRSASRSKPSPRARPTVERWFSCPCGTRAETAHRALGGPEPLGVELRIAYSDQAACCRSCQWCIAMHAV
ncbi:hypothetical protein GCM10023238_04210 [Streptomyces heliomycini]